MNDLPIEQMKYRFPDVTSKRGRKTVHGLIHSLGIDAIYFRKQIFTCTQFSVIPTALLVPPDLDFSFVVFVFSGFHARKVATPLHTIVQNPIGPHLNVPHTAAPHAGTAPAHTAQPHAGSTTPHRTRGNGDSGVWRAECVVCGVW